MLKVNATTTACPGRAARLEVFSDYVLTIRLTRWFLPCFAHFALKTLDSRVLVRVQSPAVISPLCSIPSCCGLLAIFPYNLVAPLAADMPDNLLPFDYHPVSIICCMGSLSSMIT